MNTKPTKLAVALATAIGLSACGGGAGEDDTDGNNPIGPRNFTVQITGDLTQSGQLDGERYSLLSSAETLELNASVTEDGNAATAGQDMTFLWSSNIDGELGSDRQLSTLLSPGYHEVDLTVEMDGKSVNETFDIVVVPPAHEIDLSVAEQVTESSYTEGETANLWINVSAPNYETDLFRNLDSMELRWESSIDGFLGNTSSVTQTLSVGTHTITVTAIDKLNGEDSITFVITVKKAENNSNIPRLSISESSLQFSAQQSTQTLWIENSGTGILSWSVSAPDWITVSPRTGNTRDMQSALSVTVERDAMHEDIEAGTLQITSNGGQRAVEVIVETAAANNPPSIISAAPTDITLDGEYQYQVLATDRDGDRLGYELLQRPTGMSIDMNGFIAWTPYATGTFSVEVAVTDGKGGRSTQAFSIDVSNAQTSNSNPVIQSIAATTLQEGDNFNHQVQASDIDNDPLTFSLTNAPAGMFIDSMTGEINWFSAATGSHTVNVRVSDGQGGSDSESFLLTVVAAQDVNAPLNTMGRDFINGGDTNTATRTVQLNLAANDNVGVTGYYVTESDTAINPNTPAVNDPKWRSLSPSTNVSTTVNYELAGQYASGDNAHLYVWFKDAAGNISTSADDDITYAQSNVVLAEDFENGMGNWAMENNVWEVGRPLSIPTRCYEGSSCAVTQLTQNYPNSTDDRLLSPAFEVPAVTSDEDVVLRFWQYFDYSSGDYGKVQVQIETGSGWSSPFDLAPGTVLGNAVHERSVGHSDGIWSPKSYHLTRFSGDTIRLLFTHTADHYNNQSHGWYIDDVSVEKVQANTAGDFESGWGDWHTDNSIWAVGTPSNVGPADCYDGNNCVATILNGDYKNSNDARLITPSYDISVTSGDQEAQLRFWHWFQNSSGDIGRLQISEWDSFANDWSDWSDLQDIVASGARSEVWSPVSVDLDAYEGKKVRFAFYHQVDHYNTNAPGWYIDNVEIVNKAPTWDGDFESGLSDWHVSDGIWQVGIPSDAQYSCYKGNSCVATLVNEDYPNSLDSALISPTIELPDVFSYEELHLKFWQKYQYGSGDKGRIQIAFKDNNGAWSDWEEIVEVNEINSDVDALGNSQVWSPEAINLTDIAGETVRFRFFHHVDHYNNNGAGWFLDDIRVEATIPEFSNGFENGWGDWYTENSLWQVGSPTVGPLTCATGQQCIGVILNDNYPNSTDSSLVSPAVTVPAISPHLFFSTWYEFGSGDRGDIYYQVYDNTSGWSAWQSLGTSFNRSSAGWEDEAISLSGFEGRKLRFKFRHVADHYNNQGPGWFIDDISIGSL